MAHDGALPDPGRAGEDEQDGQGPALLLGERVEQRGLDGGLQQALVRVLTVQIEEPKVERHDDGLKVVIAIKEGPQFTVGKVSVEGKDVPRLFLHGIRAEKGDRILAEKRAA